MNDLLKKAILITAVEKKATSNGKQMIKLKDEKNLTYTLWPIKNDGEESVAYRFFKNLPMDGVNMNVEISYKEEPGDFQGKAITYRTIATMNSTEQKPLGAKVARVGMMNDKIAGEDEKWDKINAEKNDHIKWLNALNNATLLASTGKIEISAIKYNAQLIYAMQPLGVKEETNYPEAGSHVEELPTINQDEEINTNEIPF